LHTGAGGELERVSDAVDSINISKLPYAAEKDKGAFRDYEASEKARRFYTLDSFLRLFSLFFLTNR
jgi:hypothetical protein